MKLKVVALVLFKFLLVSGSLAQESKQKALSQSICDWQSQSICDWQQLDSDGFDTDNLTNKAGRSGEAEVAKEAADQTGLQNLQILYKGFSLAPMQQAPLKEMPYLLPAKGPSLASKPKAATQRLERQPDGFDWDGAFRQSALFLAIQHSLRLAQAKTLEEIRGPFFGDYLKAIKGIRGWGDDDGLVTNYLGHPLMGAIGGYIQIHNDRQAKRLELSNSKAYWKSRLKAFAWSAAYSTQFEIGLVSEATLGNVGKQPGTGGYVDFIPDSGNGGDCFRRCGG
jgi:hypothetical protein